MCAAASVLLLVSSPTIADMLQPSHSCIKPYKPYEFTDQWQLDRFKGEVEMYKQCIADFIEEQNEAIENHQQAAEEAIDEWNHYVDFELR